MRHPRLPEDDPFRALAAERVELEDGRYLLYFSWPRPPEPEREGATTAPTEELDV